MNEVLFLMFTIHSNSFSLPPKLLSSVCYVESRYDVESIHEDDGGEDSLGVCQLHLSTARWLGFKGTQDQLMDPNINIYYAAKYLNHQLNRYHGNIKKALIAYNQGSAKGLTITKYSVKVINRLDKENE